MGHWNLLQVVLSISSIAYTEHQKQSIVTFALVLSRICYQRASGTTSWPRSAISQLEILVYSGTAKKSVVWDNVVTAVTRECLKLFMSHTFSGKYQLRLHPRLTTGCGPERYETSAKICIITDCFLKSLAWTAHDRRCNYQFSLNSIESLSIKNVSRSNIRRSKLHLPLGSIPFQGKIVVDLQDHPPLFENWFLPPTAIDPLHFPAHERNTHVLLTSLFFSHNQPTHPPTHTHAHIHGQAHTWTMLEGTRVTIEQIQEGPARHARSKGETRAGRCIGRRYGLEKVHMLTHGASIQVRSSSGMRLTRRLSLDWSLKASATTVRRGSHLFSRASLLAIVKDDDDVARQDALLFLSLSLVFWRLLSLPHRVCVSICVYTIRVQTRREHFLRTGLWKHTPLRNLSLESATLQRPIAPPLIFTRVLESSCPTRRSEIQSIWEKTVESLMEFETYSRHWEKSGASFLSFCRRLLWSK